MIKRIRIAIDHGNRNIKTVHTVFTTGISESDISPGRGIDYLEYNGKFYVPSNRRIHIREIRLPIKDFSY